MTASTSWSYPSDSCRHMDPRPAEAGSLPPIAAGPASPLALSPFLIVVVVAGVEDDRLDMLLGRRREDGGVRPGVCWCRASSVSVSGPSPSSLLPAPPMSAAHATLTRPPAHALAQTHTTLTLLKF